MKDLTKLKKKDLIDSFNELNELIDNKNKANDEIKILEEKQKKEKEILNEYKNNLSKLKIEEPNSFYTEKEYLVINTKKFKKISYMIIFVIIFSIINISLCLNVNNIKTNEQVKNTFEEKKKEFNNYENNKYSDYIKYKDSNNEEELKKAKDNFPSIPDLIKDTYYTYTHNYIVSKNNKSIILFSILAIISMVLGYIMLKKHKYVLMVISFIFVLVFSCNSDIAILITLFSLVLGAIIALIIYILYKIITNNISKKYEEKLKIRYKEEKEKYIKENETNKKRYEEEYNERKEKYNNQIKEKEKDISVISKEIINKNDEYNKISKSLFDNYGNSIHEDYLDNEILDIFKEYLNKGRCDNLKECINLYEQEKNYKKFQDQVDDVTKFAKNVDRQNKENISNLENELQKEKEKSSKEIEQLKNKVGNIESNVDRIDVEQKATQIMDEQRRTKYMDKKDYDNERNNALQKAQNKR